MMLKSLKEFSVGFALMAGTTAGIGLCCYAACAVLGRMGIDVMWLPIILLSPALAFGAFLAIREIGRSMLD